METTDMSDIIQKIKESMNALTSLVPGKALLDYMGCVMKRVIEPQLHRYEAFQDAKTQQKLFAEFPLKRIEFCQKILSEHPDGIPAVSMQSFENLMRIGVSANAFLRAEKGADAIVDNRIVDEEWLNRFVDEAGYVSNERLQEVFGRLLKEKITHPDAVNKRVLKILCSIDADELDIIQKYISCFVGDGIATSIMSEFDFGLNMMLELQNIGLVNIVVSARLFEEIYVTEDITRENNVIEAKGFRFVFSNVKEPFKTHIPSYVLTKEGKIIYNLIAVPMQEEVAQHYLKLYKQDCGEKATVTLEKCEV